MRAIVPVLLSAMLAFAPCAGAQEASGETPPQALQLFSCSLNDSSTMEQVWDLAGRFRDEIRGMEGIGDDPAFGTFIWTPFRTQAPFDFVWGVISADLETLGRGFSTYYASEAGPKLDEEFASLADCGSRIVFLEQVDTGRIGTTEDREPDGIVETFACRLNDGKTLADQQSVTSFYQDQVAGIGSEAVDSYEAFVLTPYRGQALDDWDFAWVGTYPDFASWGDGETAYHGSEQGQAVEQRFTELARCASSLWMGYWVVVPDDVREAQSGGG